MGIQSIEIGITILRAMRDCGGPATLGQIARLAHLQPSKVHRYLVSYVRGGMVAQSALTGEYDFGPTTRFLGLAALARTDAYSVVFEAATQLRRETDCTVLTTVWGDGGVTIVRWESGVHHSSITFRLGSTLPLLKSATGRLFLAFLADEFTTPILLRERAPDTQDALAAREQLHPLLDEIRVRRLSMSSAEILPGIEALSAPVLNYQNELLAALTLLCPTSVAHDKSLRRFRVALGKAASSASENLGAPVEPFDERDRA